MPEDTAVAHDHCYHVINRRQEGNTMHEEGICCHCGHLQARSYSMEAKSWSATKHGPFYQPEARL